MINNPTKTKEFVYHIQVLSGQWTKISCSVFRTHKCAQCELIVNSSQAKAAALQQTYSTTVVYYISIALSGGYWPLLLQPAGWLAALYMMLFRKNMEKFVVCLTLPEQFDTLFHTSVNCEFLKHLNMPLLV